MAARSYIHEVSPNTEHIIPQDSSELLQRKKGLLETIDGAHFEIISPALETEAKEISIERLKPEILQDFSVIREKLSHQYNRIGFDLPHDNPKELDHGIQYALNHYDKENLFLLRAMLHRGNPEDLQHVIENTRVSSDHALHLGARFKRDTPEDRAYLQEHDPNLVESKLALARDEDLDTLIEILPGDDPKSHQARFLRGTPDDLNFLIENLDEHDSCSVGAKIRRGTDDDLNSVIKNDDSDEIQIKARTLRGTKKDLNYVLRIRKPHQSGYYQAWQRKAETSARAMDELTEALKSSLEQRLLRGKHEDLSFVKNFEPEIIYAYRTPDELKQNIRNDPYDLQYRLMRSSESDLKFILDHHPTHLGARAIRQAPEDLQWVALQRYRERANG